MLGGNTMPSTLSTLTIQTLRASYLPERFVNKIIRDCESIFSKSIEDLMYIVLFGSCAKGTLDINSDVDLLVLTKETINRTIKADLHHELAEEIDGVSTDIIFYNLDTYLQSDCLLVKEVKKYGKILWRDSQYDRE